MFTTVDESTSTDDAFNTLSQFKNIMSINVIKPKGYLKARLMLKGSYDLFAIETGTHNTAV